MKRRLLIILMFLLLGAVVNVAVAWGLAAWLWLDVFRGQLERVRDRNTDLGVFRAAKFSRPGAMYFETRRWKGRVQQFVSPTDDPNELLPGWTGLIAPTQAYESGKYQFEYRSVDLRGWPMRSLWLEYTGHSSSGVLDVQGGLVTSALRMSPRSGKPLTRSGQSFPVALPLRPLWPGFALNTLFYAVVLWLLAGGSFALRRFWRVQQGFCPKCGYPMGESSVCTECGCGLPKRASTT